MEEAKNVARIFSTDFEIRELATNVTITYNFFLKASSVDHAENTYTICAQFFYIRNKDISKVVFKGMQCFL